MENAMKLPSLLAVALLSSVCSASVIAGAAEEAIAKAMSDYRIGDTRGQWLSPLHPSPALPVAATDTPLSADHRLMQIVAAHTRERFDRGGWENTYLRNSSYASGNPLLAVSIGSGTTLSGVSMPSGGPA